MIKRLTEWFHAGRTGLVRRHPSRRTGRASSEAGQLKPATPASPGAPQEARAAVSPYPIDQASTPAAKRCSTGGRGGCIEAIPVFVLLMAMTGCAPPPAAPAHQAACETVWNSGPSLLARCTSPCDPGVVCFMAPSGGLSCVRTGADTVTFNMGAHLDNMRELELLEVQP